MSAEICRPVAAIFVLMKDVSAQSSSKDGMEAAFGPNSGLAKDPERQTSLSSKIMLERK